MRDVQDPAKEPGVVRDHELYTHPAFGMVGVSRVSATPGVTLFGTDFLHQGFMRLTVHTAVLERGLSHDRTYARRRLVELDLSEAQWAQFVSSPNIGDGVACTLRVYDQTVVPGIPYRVQANVFSQEIKQDLQELLNHVHSAQAAVEEDLHGVSKIKTERLREALRKLEQDVRSNLPFVARSFGRYMEDTVQHAKVEISSYALQAIQRAGLEALAERAGITEVQPLTFLTQGESNAADQDE